MVNYKSVLEAIEDLQRRGYTIDFNIGFDGIQSHQSPFSLSPDKFLITEVYRFEGATNPDDQAVVYAIESKDGIKGVMVDGYGISSDPANEQLIRDLEIRH
ncbi:phosphoribosylpyrophosphate synthetase [Chryseolinea sp. H1M3-3]|uniref:phosphoribosylpyrophosphate synthetase n=1 Tax=Chryseolinea sp. H1M3-3 TaxID=3034144 RepID=UPI0023EAD9C6|nr:phosphoribosylpyrophosphate synthetase [Chryseolinea sp. H1M3-3]